MTPEQRTRAIVHNAVDRALSSRGYWVPLSVRAGIAETVLTALAEHGLVVVRSDDLRATKEDGSASSDAAIDNQTAEETLKLIRRATFDPAQFVERGDNYAEPLWEWQARAVQAALAPKEDSR